PRLPLLPGEEITNIANIYFDFNPPVITEPSVLVAEFSTGMEEMSTDHLQVYPVPARTQLNVHSTTLLTRLSILTLDGRMVREEPIQGHRALVDLQGLPSGAYLLRVTDTEGNQLHHSFLIEHE
ncbi:MAG: T9SS type A sorting domain-containing protein, partial [Flavobacteriales bacterium]